MVIVLIFIIAGIAQLVAKIRQIPPPGQRPLPPRPAPPDVADEIEEFMRRAAQRATRPRRTGQLVVQQPSPPAAEPVRAEVVAECEKSPSAGR